MRVASAFLALAVASSSVASRSVAQTALDDNEHYSRFRSWALLTQQPNPVPNMFKFCIEAYEKMIASGIAPTTVVPVDTNTGIVWKGVVKDIKEKWCDAGQKKTTGDIAAKHAPYKAALKADKLRLVIDETHGNVQSFALPGGKYTDDAKALAAAPVWFLDVGPPSNERQTCPTGGRRNSVRRYTFDAQHKLLGTTQKEYCGDPPPSAYR